MTNDQRSERTAYALGAYRAYTGDSGTTLDEDVTDLLTDLRHFCDRHGLDFPTLNHIAYEHYLAERAQEGGAS